MSFFTLNLLFSFVMSDVREFINLLQVKVVDMDTRVFTLHWSFPRPG